VDQSSSTQLQKSTKTGGACGEVIAVAERHGADRLDVGLAAAGDERDEPGQRATLDVRGHDGPHPRQPAGGEPAHGAPS